MGTPIDGAEEGPTNYFDLGSWNTWNFVDWSTTPPTLKMNELKTYTSSLINQLHSGGIKTFDLSFAQLSDIPLLKAGKFSDCSATDSMEMLAKNTSDAKTPQGENILQFLTSQLAAANPPIEPVISFGGAAATPNDFDLGFSDKQTPESLAKDLIDFIKEYHIGGVDFDFESTATGIVSMNGADKLAAFFGDLHQAGVATTLTVPADVNNWGPHGAYLNSLFDVAPFQNLFDGINLMCYNGQSYLDANNASWGIVQWVKALAADMGNNYQEAAALMHIGFSDSLDYNNPATNAGEQWQVPAGLSNGQAAAWIMQQIITQVRTELGDQNITFGTPLFWEGKANYAIGPGGESEFMPTTNSFEEQFLHYAKELRHHS